MINSYVFQELEDGGAGRLLPSNLPWLSYSPGYWWQLQLSKPQVLFQGHHQATLWPRAMGTKLQTSRQRDLVLLLT